MKIVLNGETLSIDPILSGGLSVDSKLTAITLDANGWDDNAEQIVDIPEILSDEIPHQFIIPFPSSASFEDYYMADIMIIAQGEGYLKFKALEAVPVVDCEVRIYIWNFTESEVPST